MFKQQLNCGIMWILFWCHPTIWYKSQLNKESQESFHLSQSELIIAVQHTCQVSRSADMKTTETMSGTSITQWPMQTSSLLAHIWIIFHMDNIIQGYKMISINSIRIKIWNIFKGEIRIVITIWTCVILKYLLLMYA